MRLRAWHVAALVLIAGTSARADDPEDMFGPREIAVGEAMRAGATDSTGAEMNPSGLPLTREVAFEGGFGYRFQDSATLISASGCDTTAGMPGCFFYNYAGTNPENPGGPGTVHTSTQLGGLALAYALLPHVFVGVTAKYFHFESGTSLVPSTDGFNFDAGATVRLTDLVNLAFVGYNLAGADSPSEFPRALAGGALAHLASILTLSFDARWNLEGKDQGARFGGGAELFVRLGNQLGLPIRAGLLHDDSLGATYLSGGLGIAAMQWAFDVGARFSVDGPSQTLLLASFRFFGPRQSAPTTSSQPSQ